MNFNFFSGILFIWCLAFSNYFLIHMTKNKISVLFNFLRKIYMCQDIVCIKNNIPVKTLKSNLVTDVSNGHFILILIL